MNSPLRVLVVGCSALSTGELTIALDWLRRCRRPIEAHLLVPASVAPAVAWAGAVHAYPSDGGSRTLQAMQSAVDRLRPGLLVIADLLLFHGAPYEFGASFEPLLHQALQRCPVAALDLYDWDRHVSILDCYGRVRFATAPPLPEGLARLMPSPYLSPARSTRGRGRYAMVSDAQPLDTASREEVRRELNIHGRLVLTLTSPWQHAAQALPDAAGVARHFPWLMLRLLDAAARRAGPVTLVHLGPAPMNLPADLDHLQYLHLSQMVPDRFRRLLGAADLVLTPNCIASSAVRAASMRVPCAALRLEAPTLDEGAEEPVEWASRTAVRENEPDASRQARGALSAFVRGATPLYGFLVWPLGLRRVMHAVLRDNPFAETQAHFDVGWPEVAVEGLSALLSDEQARDAVREAQARYFALLACKTDDPDAALDAIL